MYTKRGLYSERPYGIIPLKRNYLVKFLQFHSKYEVIGSSKVLEKNLIRDKCEYGSFTIINLLCIS